MFFVIPLLTKAALVRLNEYFPWYRQFVAKRRLLKNTQCEIVILRFTIFTQILTLRF